MKEGIWVLWNVLKLKGERRKLKEDVWDSKKREEKTTLPKLGGRVSVNKDYFDVDKQNPYSSSLPSNISRLFGTVIFVYEESKMTEFNGILMPPSKMSS